MLSLFGVATNGVIAAAYLAIAAIVFRGLIQTKQVTTNPLATATGVIFFTCGVGHGMHAVMAANLGMEPGLADYVVWGWDGVTAVVAVLYFALRKRFPALLRGTAMFEDMLQRQKDAVQINDNIVQDLTEAKLALELGEERQGREALERSLSSAKRIISDLLGRVDGPKPKAGQLRRRARREADPA
jgi:hypothetical protein